MSAFVPEGGLLLTAENRARVGSRAGLESALEEGCVVEARAKLCDRRGLIFDLGGVTGVMPREEVALPAEGESTREIAVITRVGKPCAFTVDALERDRGEPVARLSRRRAQERCLAEYLDHLEDGDVLPARVTHFEPFGAFCDIGCGITSLLSIDHISVSRISHPSDRFSLGESVFCAVRGRDEVRLGSRGRIALTHKELLGTWLQNAERFSAGETVVGMVRSTENYGIFVELAPNLAGLAEWKEGVSPGRAASVYIKSILPEKRKVKLVLIDTFPPEKNQIPTHYFITEGNIRDFVY